MLYLFLTILALFAGGSGIPNDNHVIDLNILNILYATFIIIGRFTPRSLSLMANQGWISSSLFR